MNILSIQSHVVYGHVGNSAAVFTLQRLGFEVWPLHTLQFSNHVGYGDWAGEVFAPDQVSGVLDALERRNLLAGCDAVLSGYLGDPGIIEAMMRAVERVRRHKPECLYLCDPVMGDRGEGVYVHDGIPELMRNDLVPAADVITPNAFELALLTGRPVETVGQAIEGARRLIDPDWGQGQGRGPKLVVVTSLPHDSLADRVVVLAVTAGQAWQVVTPWLEVPAELHGGGDTFAALFLGNFLTGRSVPDALARATAVVFALFRASQEAGSQELPLIAAQDELVAPSYLLEAEELH